MNEIERQKWLKSPTPISDAAERESIAAWVASGRTDDFPIDGYELARDLERQLADTRRRLAEVEKERDDALVHVSQMGGILRGEKLTPEQVNETGLGTWVLIEQRHAVAVEQKKLTALRNAADGMAGKMRAAVTVLQACGQMHHPESAKLMVTTLRSELNAYAALISEGVGS